MPEYRRHQIKHLGDLQEDYILEDDNTVIPKEEFWHPQKVTRPPDRSVFHTPTTTHYLRRCKVWFEERYNHWVAATPELQFIEDAAFQGPYYIAGKELDNLLKELLEVSPLTTSQTKLTATSS